MKNKSNFIKSSIVLVIIMLFLFASIASARIQSPDSETTKIQKTENQDKNQPQKQLSRTQIFTIPSYLEKNIETQEINKKFTKTTTINLKKNTPISALSISADTTLYKKDSLVRVILIDQNNNQYLVYEDYPLISQTGSIQITDLCEETCTLNSIVPKSLEIQTKNAKLDIKEIKYSTQSNRIYEPFKEQTQKNIIEKQNQFKIDQINKNKNLRWTAGLTKVSQKSFQEKQNLCKDCPPEIFYYQGGIYNTQNPQETQEDIEDNPITLTTSEEFPQSWDWRNRHSQNWVTSVKDQATCNSCWAFSATAAVEANVNLYFNQHLDLDISEQDLVSCSNAGSCENGGSPILVLDYYINTGVTQESCFSYSATQESCSNKCSNWQDTVVKITDFQWSSWPYNETWIKQNIINKGVLTSGIKSWDHTMGLVGWNTDTDSKTIWIWKNQWGDDWGEKGYANLKTPMSDIKWTYPIDYPYTIANQNPGISCVDNDSDGYCNWGLSKTKPGSCPIECEAEKDCDDSNNQLTYFEDNYECHYVECYTDDDCSGFDYEAWRQCRNSNSAGNRFKSCLEFRPKKCQENMCIPDILAKLSLTSERYTESMPRPLPLPTPTPSPPNKNSNDDSNPITKQPTQTTTNQKQQQTIYLNKKPTTIYLSNSQTKTSFIKRFLRIF